MERATSATACETPHENKLHLLEGDRAEEPVDWSKLEGDISKEFIPPPTIIAHCPKLRILIIGRPGVGKSTICAKVFGVGVTYHERGKYNINEETTFGFQNDKIIIHNSPGFEAGNEARFDETVQFIKQRRETVKLADQLHSCEDDSRPVQEDEELFFDHLKDIVGGIPVLVIFTKFDRTINAVRGDWMAKRFEDLTAGRIDRNTAISTVQKISRDHFEEMKRKHWSKIIDEHRIKVLRMSIPSNADYEGDASNILGWCPEVGVDELIETTLEHVRDPNLRSLWAAAQNSDVGVKLQESINISMERFSQLTVGESIQVAPINGAVSLWSVFTTVLNDINSIWNLVQEKPSPFLSTKSRRNILEAIFDSNILTFQETLAPDLFAFNNPVFSSKVFAHLVVGIVAIHKELFAMQTALRSHTPYVTPLTELQLAMMLDWYKVGELRRDIWACIERSDFATVCCEKALLKGVILDAIESGWRYKDGRVGQ